MEAFQQIVDRYHDDSEPLLRELVAEALVYQGGLMSSLGRWEDAVGAYTEVVESYGNDPTVILSDVGGSWAKMGVQVATALCNIGDELADHDEPAKATASYQQVVDRYRDSPDPELQVLVRRAVSSLGDT
jgi:hypothetical protein